VNYFFRKCYEVSIDMVKNKGFHILLVSFICLFLVACGENGGSNDNSSTETMESNRGESVFKKSCATCHGGDLSGGAGPSLENIASKYSEDDIKNIINNGTGTMFPVNLPDDDIEELVEWLISQ